MGDIEGITPDLGVLEHMNNQYQMRLANALTSSFPTLLSVPAVISGDGLQQFDVCGLNSRLDTDSEEDSVSDNTNKLMKNEINISKTLGLKKRINNEDIKQKFANLENEHKKIHNQIKTLQNNIIKKDKTVNDLSLENTQLNKKYEALINDINEKNSNLLEYASVNHNLEKQLEKKNMEINQLHSKCEKSDQIQTNLMKDIEYYKAELTRLKEQKNKLKDFDELRKRYNEIKRDNVKLGKKFRELKSSDTDSHQKTLPNNVLQKKIDSLQGDVVKFRTENKRLKSKQYTMEQELLLQQKLQDSLKAMEQENAVLKETISNCEAIDAELQSELHNLRQAKEQLEKEIQVKDDIIIELKEKLSAPPAEPPEQYTDVLLEQINTYKRKCEALELELENLKDTKSNSASEVQTLKDEVRRLKIRLGDLLIERDNSAIKVDLQCQMIQTDKYDEHCTNCNFLRQEVEKLGYANLRLHKEKLNLKANFQKLSVKTSKLELKMEELSADRKRANSTSVVERKLTRDTTHKDVLIQQNLMLTKKLKDVIENYDKLLKEYILLQQNRLPSECVDSRTIIQELQNHISNSQFAINTIEHKLNEEEGKLHASLCHLRTVKNKLSERKMALK